MALKVYAWLVVSPVTTKGEDAPVVVLTPQQANTVYEEIAPPPTQAGAVKVTDTDVLLAAVAVPIVGALATFNGLYPGKTIPAWRDIDMDGSLADYFVRNCEC
jgi:hypothetical protein